MSALAHPLATVEEYLAFDDATPGRHEYYRGYILAMAGGTYRHGVVSGNVITALNNALEGKPCSVTTSDVRLAVDLESHYTYPDVMVVCGEPVFTTRSAHTVRNPVVIVEVLSPSTERADRGRKFTDCHFQT